MTALKHKERWSLSSSTGLDVFYGSQIETYLRQHAADLEPGRPVPYGEIPASCFFLSVNFYQYSYELCSADGSPLEFRISTTHVFKKDSPERYAEAKAKLLKNHRHPWFKLLNGICRMPETDRELFRQGRQPHGLLGMGTRRRPGQVVSCLRFQRDHVLA